MKARKESSDTVWALDHHVCMAHEDLSNNPGLDEFTIAKERCRNTGLSPTEHPQLHRGKNLFERLIAWVIIYRAVRDGSIKVIPEDYASIGTGDFRRINNRDPVCKTCELRKRRGGCKKYKKHIGIG